MAWPARDGYDAGVTVAELYQQTIELPRALRFPVELRPPEGFVPDQPATWPRVVGRLEFVDGRLLYMPPCGDWQQDTVTDVVVTLGAWVRAHEGFVLGANAAGMVLGGAVRAADAAIWRRADVGAHRGGLRRVRPLLAVEVAGEDDDEAVLHEKAAWYVRHGVTAVWLVLPEPREVVVVTGSGSTRFGRGDRLPEHPDLPALAPAVDELFHQIG